MPTATRTTDPAIEEDLARLFAGDRALTTDPYPLYARLRAHGPVYWHRGELPCITTHAEAAAVFKDSTAFHTHRGQERFDYDNLSPELQGCVDEIVRFEHLQMSEMNGEHHRRVRTAAQRAFHRRRIIAVGEYLQEATDALFDRFLVDGRMDFMELASRLPVLAIVELMGTPREDVDMLKRWGDDIAATKPFYGGGFPPEVILRSRDALMRLKEYVGDTLVSNRANADTEMFTALLDATEEDRLSRDELAATVALFLYAAHETTTNMIGLTAYHLLAERERWDRVKREPELVGSVTEEVLRYTPPVQMMPRRTMTDTVVAGEYIPEGTKTMILIGSANRDPQVFTDPDVFAVDRNPTRHVGFGLGVHVCIGNTLARVEGKVVLDTLLNRFADVRLTADPSTLLWNAHSVFAGVTTLPIEVTGDRGATR